MQAPELSEHSIELVYDRRSSRRLMVEGPALIDASHTWRKCRLRSVSPSGFSVSTTWDLPVGSRVEVYFELPAAVAVDAIAEVVRAGQDEIAFSFLELPTDVADAIESYVARAATGEDALPASAIVC